VLVSYDNVDAESKAPTKEEIITNLNLDINTLDLDILKKEEIVTKEEKEYKEAQTSLDTTKDKRAEKLKEKANIMQGTGTVSFQ
jgi:hypothetical protein